MRKIMAIAIVLVFAGATSSWALFGLEDISFDGSIEFNGNSANNETDFSSKGFATGVSGNDHRGKTNSRVRTGINLTVTDGVKGRIELIRGTRQFGAAATTVAGEEALWAVQNAYIDIENVLGLDLFRIGRQYVGPAGDLVWNISPTDDDILPAAAIDGVTVADSYVDDKLGINIFTGKALEDDSVTGAVTDTDLGDVAGDVNLTAVDVSLNNIVPNGTINVGLLSGIDENTAVRGDDNKLRTYRVGIRGDAVEGMIGYRAEFFQNSGSFNGAGLTGAGAATDLDYGGNAIDLGVNVNLPENNAGTFGVALNILMASGDDDVIDDKDDSFHDFSPLGFNTSDRLMGEIFGKSNTLGGGVPIGQGVNTADATGIAPSGVTQGQGMEVFHFAVNYDPAWWEKGNFAVDYYSFARAEDTVRVAAGTNAMVGDDFGSEIDITVGYEPAANVNLEAGYATLSPDNALTGIAATAPDDAVTKLFFRTKVAWGGDEE